MRFFNFFPQISIQCSAIDFHKFEVRGYSSRDRGILAQIYFCSYLHYISFNWRQEEGDINNLQLLFPPGQPVCFILNAELLTVSQIENEADLQSPKTHRGNHRSVPDNYTQAKVDCEGESNYFNGKYISCITDIRKENHIVY